MKLNTVQRHADEKSCEPHTCRFNKYISKLYKMVYVDRGVQVLQN